MSNVENWIRRNRETRGFWQYANSGRLHVHSGPADGHVEHSIAISAKAATLTAGRWPITTTES
jgi:hypothetical protein